MVDWFSERLAPCGYLRVPVGYLQRSPDRLTPSQFRGGV